MILPETQKDFGLTSHILKQYPKWNINAEVLICLLKAKVKTSKSKPQAWLYHWSVSHVAPEPQDWDKFRETCLLCIGVQLPRQTSNYQLLGHPLLYTQYLPQNRLNSTVIVGREEK